MLELHQLRPTWAEINLNNIAFNFRSVKHFVGKTLNYMAVVKADAYGHNSIECSRRLEQEGIDWFGVALPEEALELRLAGIRLPILCLGGFWLGQEEFLLTHNITPVIYQIENAESYNRIAKSQNIIASVHIKIDTGMGRIGVRFDEVKAFADKLLEFKNLKIDGLMTHFAAADNLFETDFTNLQIDRFYKALEIFHEKGFHPINIDLANSPGAIAHQRSHGNLVRLGGVLYGLGADVLPQNIEIPLLKPVLSLYSQITHLKNVPKGESIGYSRKFNTQKDSIIATIPIGYQDGLPRVLSNKGKVIVNGCFAPIVGNISMDWTILDVTSIPNVKLHDKVVIIGNQNGLHITAEEIAQNCETISYEITCGINRRVTRKYVGSQ